MKKLILASGSPRRKDLLEDLGFKFDIITSDINEDLYENENPIDYVKRLSSQKANKVANSNIDSFVIGADTIVVLDDKIFGKPKDSSDAKRMLLKLSGSSHKVYTGISIVNINLNIVNTKVSESKITFRQILEDEIDKYLLLGESLDKAGAYGIQSAALKFCRTISGSFSNIIGLDQVIVYEMLKELDF